MANDGASTYGAEPLAFLSATADELVLSGTRGTFRIPRARVTRIRRGKMYPWFFSAVWIRHGMEAFPDDLQFKPLGADWRHVVETLRGLGYPSA